MVEIQKKIENLILSKDFKNARLEIKRHLSASKFSEEARLECAIYYRRMSDLPTALKLISRKLSLRGIHKASTIKVKIYLEIARLLTYLGAETSGLQIAKTIELTYPDETNEQTAFIYFWHDLPTQALDHFRKFTDLKKTSLLPEESYDKRIRMVYAAICHSKLNEFEEAESILNHVLLRSSEPVMKGTVHTYLAQNYSLKKDFRRALSESERALSYLKDIPQPAVQRTEALLTHSENLILSHQFAAANTFLQELIKIHELDGITPHHWLDVLLLKGLLEFKTHGYFSKYWIDAIVYPNSNLKSYAEKIRTYTEVPKSILIVREKIDSNRKSILFDPASDTTITQAPNGKKSHKLGMDLQDRAICILLLAGERGLSQYLFYDILWQGDLAIDQSKRKISQLLMRLRRQGYSITWSKSQIYFKNFSQISCLWTNEIKIRGGVFLRVNPTFKRSDVEKFFSLSKSSALLVCESWISENSIRKLEDGKFSAYEVII